MRAPTHIRALKIDPEMFASSQTKALVSLIKKYVGIHRAPPTKRVLISFANQFATSEHKIEEYVDALDMLKNIPKTKPEEANYYFSKLENYALGRSIYDVANAVKDKFDAHEEIDFNKLKKEIISDLLLAGSDTQATIRRGLLSEAVQERWDSYKNIESGAADNVIPFGMSELDEAFGGMRKTFVTLLYSKSAGGKTRTSINIAYNAARAGYNVMYFSLEMAFDLLANCFDSRIARVDSKEIIFGKLDRKDRRKFRHALIKQAKEKLNIWIVDVSMGAKSSLILEEIELYKATRGISPDLIVIDYANIMEPDKRYSGRSEKYDNLFQEYHEIAKFENVAILTATQESRDASKTDIEKKKKKEKDSDTEGIHNIGLSNYMAPHCESIARLKQDAYDRLQNRLWVLIDKSRYGNPGRKIALFADWKLTYVGDRTDTHTIIKRREPDGNS